MLQHVHVGLRIRSYWLVSNGSLGRGGKGPFTMCLRCREREFRVLRDFTLVIDASSSV